MNNGQRLSEWGQGAARQHLRRLGRMFVVVFCGTLFAGYLAMLAFSASGCFLSRVIRCFSVSRDLIGFSWFAVKGLFLPAAVVALMVAIFLQIRGSVVWWDVLVASLLSALVIGSVGRALSEPAEAFVLLVVSLIFFAGAQAALLIDKRLCRTSA
ncbi:MULTISPECIES: hypothetical protein [Bradyrhizobium]|uniref:hypothetical protein n=1 Tax=Bradyrhizobium TaxID=374 RepID=UPI000567C9D8|nr:MULTISPECIES: hypothetical protein [Bradyrhizobium]MCA1380079.1 hypothetical protein [Bradyrhizobium sp. BRP05]MCA1419524.1 hypothetical protein [Bradyrhizobium sp. BRP23]MCA1425563.1 hypothetical protein [Bradyrhizobium sp. NBAIM16]MCA1504172.1 hypothetical protein [Bradyrhizobium sp. NBAIM02]MCA1510723.1 hypothetical protein [Bradyrhizobium sp. NBAIM01]